MPESWWSRCTHQHLRADWKVWKMSCGVELGELRNRWWKVFATCLASCKWLWGGFTLLAWKSRPECSSPEPPRFSSWASCPSLAKFRCTVPDPPLLNWIQGHNCSLKGSFPKEPFFFFLNSGFTSCFADLCRSLRCHCCVPVPPFPTGFV